MSSGNNNDDKADPPEKKYNETQASLFGVKGDQVDWSLIDIARVQRAIAVNDEIEAQIMKLRLLPKHLTMELSRADETSDGQFVWEQFVDSIRSGMESLNSLVTKIQGSKDIYHYALEDIAANPGVNVDPNSPDFLHRHLFIESAQQGASAATISNEHDQEQQRDHHQHLDDSLHSEVDSSHADISNLQAAVAYLLDKFNSLQSKVTFDKLPSKLHVQVHSMPYFDFVVNLDKNLSVTVEPIHQRASQQQDGLRQGIQTYTLQYLSDMIPVSEFAKHQEEKDEAAIEGIRLVELVSMLCSYQTLFTQPCKLCNKIVNLSATLPPLFRKRSRMDFTKAIQTSPFDALHPICYHQQPV